MPCSTSKGLPTSRSPPFPRSHSSSSASSCFIQMIYILYILIFTFNWQRNNFHAIRSKGLPHIRVESTSQNKKQPLTLARSLLPAPSCAFLFLYSVILFRSVLFFVCRLLDCYSWQIKLETCKISLVIGKDTCVFLKRQREGEVDGERQSFSYLYPWELFTLCLFPGSASVVLSQLPKLITK